MARPAVSWRRLFILGAGLLVIGGFGFRVGMTDALGKPQERNRGVVGVVKSILGDGELFQACGFASYIALLAGLALTLVSGVILGLDSLLKPNEPPRPPPLPAEHVPSVKSKPSDRIRRQARRSPSSSPRWRGRWSGRSFGFP